MRMTDDVLLIHRHVVVLAHCAVSMAHALCVILRAFCSHA